MNQYRYKCPTKGCEIDTILVNVHEDVIEYFGFCCPFCQDHMVRDDTYHCIVCEVELPQLSRAKAIEKGGAFTIRIDNGPEMTYYRCIGKHSPEECLRIIGAIPKFSRAGKVGA